MHISLSYIRIGADKRAANSIPSHTLQYLLFQQREVKYHHLLNDPTHILYAAFREVLASSHTERRLRAGRVSHPICLAAQPIEKQSD